MENQRSRILRVNTFFLISALILIFMGGIAQSYNLILGLLFTEWVLILGLALLYTKAFKIDLKTYRFKKISKNDGIVTILITLLLYPIVIFFSLTITIILRLFFEFENFDVPIPTTSMELVVYFFVIAISAGICEEVFFRGVILNEFKSYGYKTSIIISSVLFAVFHFNYQNFIGPLILGLVFGYIVIRTGSIWAGIIGHITNNAIALSLGYMLTNMEIPEATQQAALSVDNSAYALVQGTITFGVITLFNLLFIYKLFGVLSDVREKEENIKKISKEDLLLFAPVFVTILIYLWISLGNLLQYL